MSSNPFLSSFCFITLHLYIYSAMTSQVIAIFNFQVFKYSEGKLNNHCKSTKSEQIYNTIREQYFVVLELGTYKADNVTSCDKPNLQIAINVPEGNIANSDVITVYQTSWSDQFCGCDVIQPTVDTLGYEISSWNTSTEFPTRTEFMFSYSTGILLLERDGGAIFVDNRQDQPGSRKVLLGTNSQHRFYMKPKISVVPNTVFITCSLFDSTRILTEANQTITTSTTTIAAAPTTPKTFPTTTRSNFTETTDTRMTSESAATSEQRVSIALYVGIAAGVVIVLLAASVAFLVFRLKKAAQEPTNPVETSDNIYEDVVDMSNRAEDPQRNSYQELKRNPYLTLV